MVILTKKAFSQLASLLSIMHLKGHVENLVLCGDRGFTVDEGSMTQVKNIELYLKNNKMVHDREKNVADQWVKKTIIEQRPPGKILSDLVIAS